jgi:radical SAM superfamily enzyme YgiQ (UPF0313 family)
MRGLAETIRRRVSGEVGAVHKEHGGRLRVCLVYPNTYFLGMSSLGFQAIYHLLNSDPGVVSERAFVPDKEDLADLDRTGTTLVSYESQTPLYEFDVLAFSVSYELDYVNVARVLKLAKVPVMAAERGAHHPLVLAGGAAVSINPEPLTDLVDVFVIGEGEEVVAELARALRSGGDRGQALQGAGELEGVYVADASSRRPAAQVARRHVPRLDDWPTHSCILADETEFGKLFLVEVSRGCGRGCRFCVTPACYWPLRWRSSETILEAARAGLNHRDAIGLVGAAVSDHPEIDEIARHTVAMGARLSVSSLRADSVSDALIEALVRSGAKSITIAPEAGTERLRRQIGKPIPDDRLVDTLKRSAAAGMREAKLYFMVGLPGEEEGDIAAIPGLVRRCLRQARLRRVTVTAGAFVPKPHTPFEREGMLPVRELSRRLRVIRDELRREKAVRLALESPNWSYLEGALSRGDRRLGAVIARAEETGTILSAWRAAFRQAGLTTQEFAGEWTVERERPWGFIKTAGTR